MTAFLHCNLAQSDAACSAGRLPPLGAATPPSVRLADTPQSLEALIRSRSLPNVIKGAAGSSPPPDSAVTPAQQAGAEQVCLASMLAGCIHAWPLLLAPACELRGKPRHVSNQASRSLPIVIKGAAGSSPPSSTPHTPASPAR